MATLSTLRSTSGGPALAAPRAATLVGRVFELLAFQRSRQSLADLDDALLRDIGVTREEAHREARRPIWDAAPGWRS